MTASRSTPAATTAGGVDPVPARGDADPESSDTDLLEFWRDVRRAVTAVDGRLAGGPADPWASGALQHEALAVLAAAPDRTAPMAGLAEVLGLEPGRCAALVDRLIVAGWVRRQHAGADRRVVHVALTDEGVDRERVTTALHAQQLRVELSVLGPVRLMHLREACRLLRAWDPEGAAADVDVLVSPRGPRRSDLMGLPRTSPPARPRRRVGGAVATVRQADGST